MPFRLWSPRSQALRCGGFVALLLDRVRGIQIKLKIRVADEAASPGLQRGFRGPRQRNRNCQLRANADAPSALLAPGGSPARHTVNLIHSSRRSAPKAGRRRATREGGCRARHFSPQGLRVFCNTHRPSFGAGPFVVYGRNKDGPASFCTDLRRAAMAAVGGTTRNSRQQGLTKPHTCCILSRSTENRGES